VQAFAAVSTVAIGVVALGSGYALAQPGARTACKPPIVTQAEVGKALHLSAALIEMQPAAPSGVPQVPGQPVYKARDLECDWGLVISGHIGIGDGRASLFVFGSDTDAAAWFAAYTANERRPACKPVVFATAACDQVGPFPGGVYPLFQALRGRYVAWIHLIEKKVSLVTLEALANDVFARAPN
jgi:hypothetical protein